MSFFKNLSKYKFNSDNKVAIAIFIVIFSLFFLTLEVVLRELSGLPSTGNILESLVTLLVFGLLLIYSTQKFKLLIFIFLVLMALVQIPHAVFYGSWSDPMNIYFFFQNISEVVNLVPDLEFTAIIKTLALILISVLFVYFLYRLSSKFHGTNWVNLIVIILLTFQPIRDGLLNPEKIEKRFVKDSHSMIRSFHNSYGIFFSMFIFENFGKNIFPYYLHDEYKQVKQTDMPNIFIYFGESLSSEYMSTFGYKKDTTPFLKSLDQTDFHTIEKETFSGSNGTMPSTVRFFHMLKKPDARKQAANFKTSLFKYAKQTGYETSYISTQAEDSISHIYRLIGGKYVDNHMTPSLFSKSYSTTQHSDDDLVFKILDNLNTKEPFFTVFQPNGSHAPFNDKSPEKIKKFGTSSNLAEYENSVFYTDLIVKKIINNILQKSEKPWIFIMTSDHGTHVDDVRITRSSNYKASYTVPAVIITNNKKIYESNLKQLSQCKYLFHQDISELIARLIGFDVSDGNCNSGVIFGGLLSGAGNTRTVTVDDTGLIQIAPYTKHVDSQ